MFGRTRRGRPGGRPGPGTGTAPAGPMRFSGREIPFARDNAGRMVPWLIAPMICLAALAAVGGASGLSRATGGLDGDLTVHLPPGARPAAELDAAAERIAAILRRQPGIRRVRVLDRAQVAALLQPWLGAPAGGTDAAPPPLPRLLDVRLVRGERPNLGALRRTVRSIVAGATVVNSRQFLAGYRGLGGWLLYGGLAVAALVLALAALTLVFATRASVGIHREPIQVLSLIGAQDSHIAGLFARHAFWQALAGSLYGLAGAVIVLAGALLVLAGGSPDGAVRLAGQVPPWAWLLPLALPVLAAFTARAAARLVAMRALARME